MLLQTLLKGGEDSQLARAQHGLEPTVATPCTGGLATTLLSLLAFTIPVCSSAPSRSMHNPSPRSQAVMNYSMEERGKAVLEPEVAARGGAQAGVGRFLTGDLSYFGVSPRFKLTL